MTDDVTTVHDEYDRVSDQWQRCRDVHAGSDAVKAAGTKYLPKLDGMNRLEQYQAYVARALFYPVLGRTVQGLGGAIFRKPLAVAGAETIERDLQDITLSGVTFQGLAFRVLNEILIVGRGGLLLDYADGAPGRPYGCRTGPSRSSTGTRRASRDRPC